MTTIYDETFEAWRRELHSSEIQNLRPDYYKDLAAHIRRLREAQRNLDQKSLKANVLEDELNRLQQLVQQLMAKRVEKMARGASQGLQLSVSPWEKWVLEEYTNIARHLDRVREDLVRGKEPLLSPERKKATIFVRFLKDVPSIIGVDLRAHGPFLEEDIAGLPWENAESLIRQGVAVEIRPSRQENG